MKAIALLACAALLGLAYAQDLFLAQGGNAKAFDHIASNATAGNIVGWYAKNWGNISPRPTEGPNNAFLFTGVYDFPTAMQYCTGWTNDCKKAADDTSVNHWLVVGGDKPWSKDMITKNIAYVKANGADLKKAYAGVNYDIEQAQSTAGELVTLFAEMLKATKDAGLGTMITMSWSGPLQADGYQYTKAWAADPNLDYLSPQIYSGMMKAPYSMANPPTTGACPKCDYEIFKDNKTIVVSVQVDGDYKKLKDGFFAHSSGFILW